MTRKFTMRNLDCANCAAKMESAINKIDGVNKATVSFMSQRLTIDASEESFGEIIQKAKQVCKKIEPDCEIVA